MAFLIRLLHTNIKLLCNIFCCSGYYLEVYIHTRFLGPPYRKQVFSWWVVRNVLNSYYLFSDREQETCKHAQQTLQKTLTSPTETCKSPEIFFFLLLFLFGADSTDSYKYIT